MIIPFSNTHIRMDTHRGCCRLNLERCHEYIRPKCVRLALQKSQQANQPLSHYIKLTKKREQFTLKGSFLLIIKIEESLFESMHQFNSKLLACRWIWSFHSLEFLQNVQVALIYSVTYFPLSKNLKVKQREEYTGWFGLNDCHQKVS